MLTWTLFYTDVPIGLYEFISYLSQSTRKQNNFHCSEYEREGANASKLFYVALINFKVYNLHFL